MITPPTSRGRLSGKHKVDFTNWGSAALYVALEGSDPDEALDISVSPSQLELPIGASGTVRVKVRPRSRLLRGQPVVHPFRLSGPGAQPPIDAAFEQRPLLGLPVLLGALVLVLVVAAVVWLLGRSSPSEDAAGPPVPEDVTAEAISHDLMRLEWTPIDGVDSYRVVRIAPEDAQASEPPTLDVIEDIPGDQRGFDVGGLDGGQTYCFQVASVRSGEASSRSAAVCADSLERADTGTPTEITVERVGEQARLTWVDASAGEAEHIVRRNGTAVALVPPATTEVLVDLGDGESCFEIQSRLAGATSDPSPEQCLADDTPPTGPTEDLGVVAVVRAIPIEDPQAEQRAVQFRDQLIAEGHDAAVLNTADYPALTSPTGNFFWVYVGGFESAADAAAYCQAEGLTCFPEAPGPPA
jgi:hypothetical protein